MESMMSTGYQSSLVDAMDLAFEDLVSNQLVHKKSVDNVFLTDLKQYGKNWFLCGARVPQTHFFFNQPDRRRPASDLLFYVEAGRQSSIALSHSFFNVSFDQAFVFDQSEITLLKPAWNADKYRSQNRIVIEIKIAKEERHRNGAISRLVADYTYYNDEEQILCAKGAWSMPTAALFQRLRRHSNRSHGNESAVPVLASAGCGNNTQPNAAVASAQRDGTGCDFTTQLIVNPMHSFFFDHPCDHVPGMLLIEGCAQFATDAVAQLSSRNPKTLLPRHSTLQFMQFAECYLPVWLTAHCNPPESGNGGMLHQTVDITISQEGMVLGKAAVSVVHL